MQFRKVEWSGALWIIGWLMVWIIVFWLLNAFPTHAQTAAYPDRVATDADLKVARNGVQTVLRGPVTASDTVWTVADASQIVPNMLLTVDREIVSVTAVNGSNITVLRGVDGTTPTSHASGKQVSAFIAAWHHNALKEEIKAIESALGPNLSNILSGPLYTLHADVRLYGAKGDGSTNDTAAFQKAIDSGYPVFVPKGVYIITPGVLTFTSPVYGLGPDTSILKPSANGQWCIKVSHDITSVAVDASAVTLSDGVVVFENFVGRLAQNVRVYGGTYGYRFGENTKFSTLRDIRSVNATTASLAVVEPAGGWVSPNGTGECRLENVHADGTSTLYGFYLSRTTDVDHGAWYFTYFSSAYKTNSMRLVSTAANTWGGVFCHMCVLDASTGPSVYASNVTDLRWVGGWFFPSGSNNTPLYLSNVSNVQLQDAHVASVNGPMLRIGGTSSNINVTGNWLRGDVTVGIVDILAASTVTHLNVSGNVSDTKPLAYAGAESRVLAAMNTGWRQSGPVRFNTASYLSGPAAVSIYDPESNKATYVRRTADGLEYVNNDFSDQILKLFDAGPLRLHSMTAAQLPECNSATAGAVTRVTDSTSAVWGDAIVGSGTNSVLAYCNGSSWTVTGK